MPYLLITKLFNFSNFLTSFLFTLSKRFKSFPILRFIRFCDAFHSSIEHYQAVVRYYVNYNQNY